MRFSHHMLPDGTRLYLTSMRGNLFIVELLSELFYGHSRYVQVVGGPITYSGPTIMCVVPLEAPVRFMADAYLQALPDVGRGDIVYLIDLGQRGAVRPFCVAKVTLTI